MSELPIVENLMAGTSGDTEMFRTLLARPGIRLEQIVSHGEASAPGFWYDQEQPEWVLLAQGTAVLRFEPGGDIGLRAGDFVMIPAHRRHRVESVSGDAVWLALHFAG